MNIQGLLNSSGGFKNLDLIARQVVEGFISGLHKSPFHGFSAEFAEHKVYNPGESTKHVDWKLFAKTDKLFTKRYDDETNLRCHIIIDNSPSMHYPKHANTALNTLNKIGFSVLASAAILQLLKRQRDAVGLSVYNNSYDFYAPEKGSERHQHMLLHTLGNLVATLPKSTATNTYTHLHQIAKKLKKRSMVVLFTDMFQTVTDDSKVFEALQHLKHNKHEVVLFHVFDKLKEFNFDFANKPKRFVDIETGETINLYPETVKTTYKRALTDYFASIKSTCTQYKIAYVEADIRQGFSEVLSRYLLERQKFR